MGNVIKSRIIVEWAMEEPNWKNIRKIQHRIPSRFRLRIVENARPLEYIALSYNHCQNCCNKTDINIFSTCPPTWGSWETKRGGGGGGREEGGDIKNCETLYLCGHVTTHFGNDCGFCECRPFLQRNLKC